MLKGFLLATVCLGLSVPCFCQPDLIENALSAAPKSISEHARVMDWDFHQLRPGTNEWTCLPDNPETLGSDPMCVNEPWLNLLHAYVNRLVPSFDGLGIAYMMGGDSPRSNSNPYAVQPTGPEDWVEDVGPHLMVIVPDKDLLKSFSTDHRNGGPWVMWPDTPYAHLMVPINGREVMEEEEDTH